jgi:rifampicin phosphotransferase
MSAYVVSLQEIDHTQLLRVGGKGLNLGELSKMDGIHVPEGFCVTTEAYHQALKHNEAFRALVHQLTKLNTDDRDQIGELCKKIRKVIMEVEIPSDVVKDVSHVLTRLGDEHAYAVRSSATAEDLPHASFAGQQDTYLNIIGKDAILQHIRKCWSSLYTDRAVIYRMQNGFDHSQVHLSVIIQRMVFPQASGVLFTADPIHSNRKVVSIDASFGLGEAIVSGLVTADCYKVQEDNIVDKMIATKKWAIYGQKEGGTETQPIDPDQQNSQTLTDQQILQLARIGKQIETYFGCPQDIEWCLVDDTFYIVQSRPITTLYPIPEADDQENRVYISVGHQQMMTDPMKPLGLSIFQLTSFQPMKKAGGRLFVDVTHLLASPDSREMLFNAIEQSDPLIKDALITIVEREGFIKSRPKGEGVQHISKINEGMSWGFLEKNLHKDPTIVRDLIKQSEASLAELKQNIQTKSGLDLFDFILEDCLRLGRVW